MFSENLQILKTKLDYKILLQILILNENVIFNCMINTTNIVLNTLFYAIIFIYVLLKEISISFNFVMPISKTINSII